MNRDLLAQQLTRHEGLRLKAYRDPAGFLTIGVGRNLETRGISQDEAGVLLANDIAAVEAGVRARVPEFYDLSDVRQRVLCNMAFNLGVGGLMQFHDLLDALARYDFAHAAEAMLNSAWARQVGGRATELAAMMRTGQDA